MHLIKIILTVFFITAIFTSPASLKANGDFDFFPDQEDFDQAQKILDKLTVEEKIGQLVHIGINGKYINQDSPQFLKLKRYVSEKKIGGVIVFVGGVYETVHLVNRLQEKAKIPLLVSADFETGVGMRFFETENLPWNMAIAATGNPAFARRLGIITAREARALGVQQVFAPVIDVNNNPENPVINVRSFGENPEDVARFGVAFSNGLQSGNVLATAKHFPGHGDTKVDSHRGLPIIYYSRERLEKIELLPFRHLIKNNVGSVMISHISLPKLDGQKIKPLKNSLKADYTESEIISENITIPATLSKKIVTGILKEDYKFKGLVVTDAMDMSGLTLYFNQKEAAIQAILAGNDVLIKPAQIEETIEGLTEAVVSKRISENRLDQSVKKIIAWKIKLGLFEKKITPLEEIDKIVSNQETRNLSDDISRNAITLVENKDKLLPLKPGQKALLLCLTNGNDINFVGKKFASNLRLQGLKVERLAIDKRTGEKEIARAFEKAKKSDLVLVGLFGRIRSGAVNSAGIPASGEKGLKKLLKGKKNILTISFGNPYLILGFPKIKNYIVSYGDMDSLQKATADAIFGKLDFNGKLPVTIGKYPRGHGLNLRK